MGIQIRMVAGFADVVERKEMLVAEACNRHYLQLWRLAA
jgi:hypothetical protein